MCGRCANVELLQTWITKQHGLFLRPFDSRMGPFTLNSTCNNLTWIQLFFQNYGFFCKSRKTCFCNDYKNKYSGIFLLKNQLCGRPNTYYKYGIIFPYKFKKIMNHSKQYPQTLGFSDVCILVLMYRSLKIQLRTGLLKSGILIVRLAMSSSSVNCIVQYHIFIDLIVKDSTNKSNFSTNTIQKNQS